MKKIIFLCSTLLLLFGCSPSTDLEALDTFDNKISKLKEYHLEGELSIYDNEENYKYDVMVDYLNNLYLVKMINKDNKHEQIILKSNDGLYVITPSLNKSFKFDSNWPDNSSQSYILSALLNDLRNGSASINSNNDGYIIETKVNYPNNSSLKYEKIYLDHKCNLTKVEVFDENDTIRISLGVNKLDYKTTLKENDFVLDNYIKNEDCTENCNNENSVSKIESAIYPLFVPVNTYLSSSEIINDSDSSRAIITFSGDKNYVLVEELANVYLDHEIIPVYGEPIMLNDTIAAMSSNSLNWTSNGVNYYLASDDLTTSEMVSIAQSLTNAQNVAYIK